MALLSSRGISTPSLQAQGGQRRSSYFNNDRDIALFWHRGFSSLIFSTAADLPSRPYNKIQATNENQFKQQNESQVYRNQ